MNTLKIVRALTIGCATAMSFAGGTQAATANPPAAATTAAGTNVTVVNVSTKPVPVVNTQAVQITATSPIPVTQTGPTVVTGAGGAAVPVSIASPSTLAVAVTNTAPLLVTVTNPSVASPGAPSSTTIANTATSPVPFTLIDTGRRPAWRYVGQSSLAVKPDGVLVINAACAATYGSGRMCSTTEIVDNESDVLPGLQNANYKWVKPVLRAVGVDRLMDEASGAQLNVNQSLNCSGWSSNGFHTVVDDAGSFQTFSCTLQLPVACCVFK